MLLVSDGQLRAVGVSRSTSVRGGDADSLGVGPAGHPGVFGQLHAQVDEGVQALERIVEDVLAMRWRNGLEVFERSL